MNIKSLFKKSFLIPLLVLIFVLSLYYFEDQIKILKKIELDMLDLRFFLRGAKETSGNIAIVAIDEKSIAEEGRWPWPRDKIAGMIDLLSKAQARVIALDIIFSEPSSPVELEKIRELEGIIGKQKTEVPEEVAHKVKILKEYFSTDQMLSETLAKTDNVVGAVYFTLPGEKGKGYTADVYDLKEFKKSRYRLIANKDKKEIFPVIEASDVTLNIPVISSQFSAEGFVNYTPDVDGVIRREPAVVEYKGGYYPSLPLQAARLFLGIPLEKTRLVLGEKVQFGHYEVPLTEDNYILVDYYGPNETFPYYSFVDVLEGKIGLSLLKNKIVLVGGTDPGLWDTVSTPFSPNVPGVETHANVIENAINQKFLVYNNYTKLLSILSVLLLVILTGWLLPKLSAFTSTLTSIIIAVCYLSLTQWGFNRFGTLLNLIYPLLALSLNYTAITLRSLMIEQKEKKKIKSIFESCVAKSIVNRVLAHPEELKLGGERKEVTVLFSDIADFTHISEKLDPETTARLLNQYFSRMAEIIIRNKGTIDKYMGDGLMAIFGAPAFYPEHPRCACQTALDMIKEIDDLKKMWENISNFTLSIRIGINTGEMMVGYVGSRDIMNYTVIGKEVNISKRLEDINRRFGTNIIIGENTYEYIKDSYIKNNAEFVKLEPTIVRGVEEPLNIYELKRLSVQ